MLRKIRDGHPINWWLIGASHFMSKKIDLPFKDVCAHCYCASLVRTLYMTWRVPRHAFQARAPSRNSTKYRADDLCGTLGARGFSCAVSGVGHVSIVIRAKNLWSRARFL